MINVLGNAKNLGSMLIKEMWKRQKNVKKEKNVFENKLTECIGKPKDLWKAVMSLGLPNTSGGCIVVTFVENQIVKHDT